MSKQQVHCRYTILLYILKCLIVNSGYHSFRWNHRHRMYAGGGKFERGTLPTTKYMLILRNTDICPRYKYKAALLLYITTLT